MNLAYHAIPIAAVALGQLEAPTSALAVYGPLGVICAWLMWRDERRAIQSEKLRESIDGVAHEMRGVNLNFLMVQASHGPESLRELAKSELQRKQGKA